MGLVRGGYRSGLEEGMTWGRGEEEGMTWGRGVEERDDVGKRGK